MNPAIKRDRKTLTVSTHNWQCVSTYDDVAIGPSEIDARCFYVEEGCLFIEIDGAQQVYAPGGWDHIAWK